MLKSLNSGGSLPGQFRNLQLTLIDKALQLRGLGPARCSAAIAASDLAWAARASSASAWDKDRITRML